MAREVNGVRSSEEVKKPRVEADDEDENEGAWNELDEIPGNGVTAVVTEGTARDYPDRV